MYQIHQIHRLSESIITKGNLKAGLFFLGYFNEQKEFLNPQTSSAIKQFHTVPKPLTVAWQYTHGIYESLASHFLQVSYN